MECHWVQQPQYRVGPCQHKTDPEVFFCDSCFLLVFCLVGFCLFCFCFLERQGQNIKLGEPLLTMGHGKGSGELDRRKNVIKCITCSSTQYIYKTLLHERRRVGTLQKGQKESMSQRVREFAVRLSPSNVRSYTHKASLT